MSVKGELERNNKKKRQNQARVFLLGDIAKVFDFGLQTPVPFVF